MEATCLWLWISGKKKEEEEKNREKENQLFKLENIYLYYLKQNDLRKPQNFISRELFAGDVDFKHPFWSPRLQLILTSTSFRFQVDIVFRPQIPNKIDD